MPELPKQLGGPTKEPVIYTIPDQFYGLAAKAQLPAAVVAPASQMPGQPISGMPAPPAPGAPPAPAKEKGSKAWILIPIIALLLVGGLGFGIWWFLKPKPAPAPIQPSVTLPTPQPKPEPQPEPEPEPEPEPATTTPETPVVIPPEADGDGDGLTQAEEELFATDPRKSDTDDDGFSDSVEVTNLYNPTGFRPTRLVEANLVTAYAGSDAQFSKITFLYPTSWTAGERGAQDPVFIVGPPAGAFELGYQFDDVGKSVLDHFLERYPQISPSQVQSFVTKAGFEGVRGPELTAGGRRFLYAAVAIDDEIIWVTYADDESAAVLFRSTFTMFLNSFAKRQP